jgi:pro-kumamolisin-like protein/Big-like domain-containing protein
MVCAVEAKTIRHNQICAWVLMRIQELKLCRGAVLGALVLLFSCVPARAQTAEVAAQTARAPARITEAVDEANLATLHGNVHRLARPEFDQGAIADSTPTSRMVLLLQRSQEQETALRQLLDEQQSKDAKNYHAWLTPEQFGKQFAPATEDIQTVKSWLEAQGFQIGHVAAGGMFIEFTGTVGQVRNTFHTDIHRFVVNGKEHFANVSDPQIPAALRPVVAGVTSLHNFPRKSHIHRRGVFQRSKDTGEVRPLFSGGSGSSQFFALGPADFAKIYNVPASLDGTGQTIAIVNDSNINMSDVTAFRQFFGLAGNNTNVVLNGPDPGIDSGSAGDETEADLDVEWSGAIAPKAKIDLVISENPTMLGATGVDLSALYIVENNLAPVMSESFGDCEPTPSGDTFYIALWEQAAAQGITAMVSTGDSGSAACDGGSGSTETAAVNGLAVSGIAASAFNVAVGGTDFDDASNPTAYWNTTNAATTKASAKSYIPETTWNNSCASTAAANSLATCATVNSDGSDLGGGSGGPSKVTAKPSWQTGTGVPVGGMRDLPDVSLFASNGPKTNNFYVVCEADAVNTASDSCVTSGSAEFLAIGGTSASSPAFAAIMALINQQTGQRQGNANYVLYKLAAMAGASCNSSTFTGGKAVPASCIFYDTTKGNNSVACVGGSTNCSNTSTGANQFGVLVDPSAPKTPAWTTTTGYDRATGLGSVNVANVATNWTKATFSASTTQITSSPSSSVPHGTNANFTVKVTAGATGDVSLIAGPAGTTQQQVVAIGPFKLVGGTATITTDLLPGGTSYPVKAHYAGDGTFGGSDSAAVTVTVTPETSKTAIALVTGSGIATTAAYGSPYVLRVDVTNGLGTSCSTSIPPIPCPTGKVTVTDNGNPLNDFSGTNSATLMNTGFLEDQPVQLPAGAHSLVAAYAGDNSYSGSPSLPDAVTITTAPTTIGLATSATTVALNQKVTITATIGTQSSGVGPTGTVTFASGSTTIGTSGVSGTAAVNNTASPTTASGTASITTSFTMPGTKSITATYTGDANYAGAGPSTPVTLTVSSGKLTTTTTATSNVTSVAAGGNVMLTAKVTAGSNGGSGPTGTVQFMNGSSALGTAATCTPTAGTSSTPGSCTATLTTALSLMAPPVTPRRIPNIPVGPMWIVACLLLMVFLLSLKRVPVAKRWGYACAGLLLFAGIAAGITGCGGGSSNGSGSTGHSDSITAVYSGDANYAGSTSAAVAISIK